MVFFCIIYCELKGVEVYLILFLLILECVNKKGLCIVGVDFDLNDLK